MIILAVLLLWGEGLPLTLSESISMALSQNRRIQASKLDLADADLRLHSAKDQFRWLTDGGFSLADDEDASGLMSLGIEKQMRFGTSLSLQGQLRLNEGSSQSEDGTLIISQPILGQRIGKQFHESGLRSATDHLDQSLESFRSQQQELVVQIIQAFYRVLLEERIIRLKQKGMQRIEAMQEATAIKLKIGKVSQADMFRVKLLANRNHLAMARARASLSRTQRELSELMGMKVQRPLVLSEPDLVVPKVDSLPLDRLLNLYDRQPAYQSLLRQKREAEIRVSLAKKALFPDMSLNLTFYTRHDRFDATNEDGGSFSETDSGVRMSLASTTDFGAKRKARRYQQLLAHNELVRLDLSIEEYIARYHRLVQDQIQGLGFQEAQLTINKESLAFAEQQLEVAQLRFQRGLTDNFKVIDAEERLLQSSDDLERNRVGLIGQWARLKITLNLLEPTTSNTSDLLKISAH